nr:hypothetical protein CFP56_36401 [Quercus suber]
MIRGLTCGVAENRRRSVVEPDRAMARYSTVVGQALTTSATRPPTHSRVNSKHSPCHPLRPPRQSQPAGQRGQEPCMHYCRARCARQEEGNTQPARQDVLGTVARARRVLRPKPAKISVTANPHLKSRWSPHGNLDHIAKWILHEIDLRSFRTRLTQRENLLSGRVSRADQSCLCPRLGEAGGQCSLRR